MKRLESAITLGRQHGKKARWKFFGFATAAFLTAALLSISAKAEESVIDVNMPASGDAYVTISEEGQKLKIYDAGGKDGGFSAGSKGTLHITSPEGTVLSVSGTVDLGTVAANSDFDSSYNLMRIFSGGEVRRDQLLLEAGSDYYPDQGTEVSTGLVTSTTNQMTIWAATGSEDAKAGQVELEVTCSKRSSDRESGLMKQVQYAFHGGGSYSADFYYINDNNEKKDISSSYPNNLVGPGNLVQIKYVPANSNAHLTDLYVETLSGKRVPIMKDPFTDHSLILEHGSWYETPNEAYFVMPGEDVKINLVFSGDPTYQALTMNLPSSLRLAGQTVTYTIPSGVKSFMLYGTNGKGHSNAQGYLANLQFEVQGKEHDSTERYFSFSGTLAPSAADTYYGADVILTDGAAQSSNDSIFSTSSQDAPAFGDIGSVSTTKAYAGVSFHQPVSSMNSMPALLVDVVDPTALYSVLVRNRFFAGTITATYDEASTQSYQESSALTVQAGKEVGLSYQKEDGYYLNALDIREDFGDYNLGSRTASSKDCILWYAGIQDSVFTMPRYNVLIEPIYTKNTTAEGEKPLYINFPKNGTQPAVIPDTVTSFKIYDDGGATGTYSKDCNGTLQFTLPAEGEKTYDAIHVEGTVDVNGALAEDGTTPLHDYLKFSKGGTYFGTNVKVYEDVKDGESLYFRSDSDVLKAGLDLTATLVTTQKIHFDPNGGKGDGDHSMDDFTLYYELETQLPDCRFDGGTRDFLGWSADKNAKTPEIEDGQKLTAMEGQRGKTTTLYAVWGEARYEIIFDGNGADSGSMEAIEGMWSAQFKLPANQYVKQGYKFVSWNTKADGSGDTIADQQHLTASEVGKYWKAKLYAIWATKDTETVVPPPKPENEQKPGSEGEPGDDSEPGDDGSEGDSPFEDVTDPEKWYYKPVIWAYGQNITSGIDAKHFGPNLDSTRAQAMTFLYRAKGSPAVADSAVSTAIGRFTDVSSGKWFTKPVAWAVTNQITNGTGTTTFGTNDSCTRAQIVTFLWKAVGSPSATTGSGFSDVPEGTWYTTPVAWAAQKGITNGVGDGKFGPDQKATRAQIVTFLYNALK